MKNLTTIDFQDSVEDGISLVKFWASWWQPCKRYAPFFEEFANDNPDIKCYAVDAESQQDLCSEYHITSIPVTLLFKDGEHLKSLNGILSKEQLSELTKSC